MPNEPFSAISWREKVIFDEMLMMSALLDTHTWLDFYRVILLKQQSTGRHVAPL